MIIVYLAIILVILGFIFVITSVEVRKEIVVERTGFSHRIADTALTDQKPGYEVAESSLSRLSERFPDESSLKTDSAVIAEDDVVVSKEKSVTKSLYDVTLYVDKNGISLESGQIDSASLKRVDPRRQRYR